MIKFLVLKQNSVVIRLKIRVAGIKLCFCGHCSDAEWLVYNAFLENVVYGVGGISGLMPKECLTQTESEWKMVGYEVIECKDCEEFINKIKEIQNEKERGKGKNVQP